MPESAPTTNACPAACSVDPRSLDFGRYRVLAQLGEGGMGRVYEAYDPELERRVAVKTVEVAAGTAHHARFMREARAMARFVHPNIVSIFDVGVLPDTGLFLVMQLARGRDLRAWLKIRRPWPEVLRVMLDAGRGLSAAHEQGFVHRDFKPDNVLISDEGLYSAWTLSGRSNHSHATSTKPAAILDRAPASRC